MGHSEKRATWKRPVAGAVATAGLVAGTRHVRRRRALIAEVAPELRHPVLYLPTNLTSVTRLRLARRFLVRATRPRPGVIVAETTVPGVDGGPGVAVITYHRRGATDPTGAVVWIHGGGTVLGRAEIGHEWCSTVADELGLFVVSVDYRLAPEHPFPAALDDCVAALRWLQSEASELNVDVGRIAVGGDSAGGLLAASTCQRARDEGGPPVRFQLLRYPMLDDRTVLRCDATGADALIWPAGSNRFGWTAYLGHAPTSADERPYAVPARMVDLAGLPPTWIGVGDIDLFHDEDVEYAARLTQAGVACQLHVVPGMYHGAEEFRPNAPSLHAIRTQMLDALRSTVG